LVSSASILRRSVSLPAVNAGFTQPVKLLDITASGIFGGPHYSAAKAGDWDRIQDVNLKGVLFLSQAVIPHMRRRKTGSIACMSSVSAQRGGVLGLAKYRRPD
jgi:NAD(P)-dependent dehydrogenase (short-subunit alcohol dehydrogenase family)